MRDDGDGDGDDGGHWRLRHSLRHRVAPQPLARFASWSAPIVGSGRTDTVGFPIGSQTRTLGGHTVTWIPRNPRGIGSWSADRTASSTQYGMLRSSWRRRPRRPCGGISKLSSAQSRSHGKRGSGITHTGRRSADRTNFPVSGGPVRTNFPASGGPVQSLPDLPRSGLRAPEGDEGRSLCRDISVVFTLLSVVV